MATVEVTGQDATSVDGDTFTTTTYIPVANSLYVVFVCGRTGDVAARVPTLTGTNGWNVTWTRLAAAQSIYTFTGVDRGSLEVFWGISGTGGVGTFTIDYGAGTDLRGIALSAVVVRGGAYLADPIGATVSANSLGATTKSVTGTLTSYPASSSVVIAAAMSDNNGAVLTAGGDYIKLGVARNNDANTHQPEYMNSPRDNQVSMSFSASDICAISGVEIKGLPVPDSNAAKMASVTGAV